MAACDLFEVAVSGQGCHAAMPHLGTDVVLAASSIVAALHACRTRSRSARLRGHLDHASARGRHVERPSAARDPPWHRPLFKPAMQDAIESAIRETAGAVAAGHRCRADVRYERRYPATINDPEATGRAARAAAMVVGGRERRDDPTPSMARGLRFHAARAPVVAVRLATGQSKRAVLHNARYDFNDAILPIGAPTGRCSSKRSFRVVKGAPVLARLLAARSAGVNACAAANLEVCECAFP